MCTNRLAERESRPDEGASSSKELTSSQNNKEEIKSGESSTESDDEVSLELECRENIDEEDVESVILEDEDLESKVFPQQRFSPLLTPKTLTSKRSRTPDLGKVRDRKSTRLNSSHANISYAVFCLKKKKKKHKTIKFQKKKRKTKKK